MEVELAKLLAAKMSTVATAGFEVPSELKGLVVALLLGMVSGCVLTLNVMR